MCNVHTLLKPIPSVMLAVHKQIALMSSLVQTPPLF